MVGPGLQESDTGLDILSAPLQKPLAERPIWTDFVQILFVQERWYYLDFISKSKNFPYLPILSESQGKFWWYSHLKTAFIFQIKIFPVYLVFVV